MEAEEEKKIDKAISDLDEKTKTYTDQLFKLSLEIDELFEESDDCIWGVFEEQDNKEIIVTIDNMTSRIQDEITYLNAERRALEQQKVEAEE